MCHAAGTWYLALLFSFEARLLERWPCALCVYAFVLVLTSTDRTGHLANEKAPVAGIPTGTRE